MSRRVVPTGRRLATPGRVLAVAVAALLLCAAAAVAPSTRAGFVASTVSTNNSFATAASFAWTPVPSSATTSASNPISADPARSSQTPRLADVGGMPWVTWVEATATAPRVLVKQWTGTTWTAVGGALSTEPAQQPVIAYAGGAVHVAWAETSGGISRVRISRWSGTAWQPLLLSGQVAWNLDAQRDAHRPRLATDGTTLWMVWQEADSSGRYPQVKFRSINATTGTAGSSGVLNVDAARDAVDPDVAAVGGRPYVTWSELDGSGVWTVRVRDLGGSSTWSGLNVTAGRNAFAPSIAAGTDGVPHVAFREEGSGCWLVRARRWTGSTWAVSGSGTGLVPSTCTVSSVGGGTQQYPQGVPNAGDPSIHVHGTTPVLVWHERSASGSFDMVVAAYTAAADRWTRLTVLDVDAARDAVSGHVTSSGGRRFATFVEWDGAVWKVRVSAS